MVADGVAHALGELPLDRLFAAEAVERIDLDRPPALGLQVGIAGNLADAGDSPLNPHQGDHIRVATSLVGAQHQQILTTSLHPAGEGIGDRLETCSPVRGIAAKKGAHGCGQGQSEAEADGDGNQNRTRGFHGWSASPGSNPL